jgi:hypothetical protein
VITRRVDSPSAGRTWGAGLDAERSFWAPSDVDPSRPSVARVYDYYLGGSHNFESDRNFATEVIRSMPAIIQVARDNREFLRRVVRSECARGVEQFLDLGSGIPTVGNVHEVAREANPRSRVVYVDHDPIAITHSRALLADEDQVIAIPGDLRNPDRVVGDAFATGLLEPDRPLAVLLISVLHFIADADRPAEIIGHYLAAASSGSSLALSHGRHDGSSAAYRAARVYQEEASSPSAVYLRSRVEIEGFFDGLTLVRPGLVEMPLWRTEPAEDIDPARQDLHGYPFLAGVGHKA